MLEYYRGSKRRTLLKAVEIREVFVEEASLG